jgi:hypothetical protein
MNMRNAVRQYNFMIKDSALIRYFNWFKGAEFGSPNGSTDIKNMGLTVSKTKVVLQNESGEKPLIIWLKRFSLSGQSWNRTKHSVLFSPALVQRLLAGNLTKERFVISHPSLPLPEFSPATEKQVKLSQKEIAIISLILTLRQRRLETSIKQTLWVPDISEVQKGLSDSILFTLWMWQDIQLIQVSSLINRLFPCAGIWLRHGDIWAFPVYLRWITRCLLQVEDAIPTAFLKSFAFTCFWVSTLYSSLKENQEEMPLLKALINSGRKECLEDIVVLTFFLLEEPVNDSCDITIMRNLTGVLPKKNMARDSLEYLETESGDLLDICPRNLTWINILIPRVILISLLQGEEFPLFERLTLMVKLRSMVLHISSGESLRVNMLLLLLLLIERDWLLNKGTRLLSLSLSQLRVILLLLRFNIQRGKLNLLSDVMRFLSIKNQLAML